VGWRRENSNATGTADSLPSPEQEKEGLGMDEVDEGFPDSYSYPIYGNHGEKQNCPIR
jgi:hypothetical protein